MMPASVAAQDAASTTPATGTGWSRGVRLVVSLLLLFQLTAILIGPFTLPPTYIGSLLQPWFRPYLGATYLDHSYKFFAPDPGPSHLVRYDLEFADDSHQQGIFPSLDDHWPRLYYHRHFMLSEFINIGSPDVNVPPQTDWTRIPLSEQQQQYARSYAEHLLKKHHARRVTLWLRQHLIPTQEQVERGMKLDDPSLYRERQLGSYARM